MCSNERAASSAPSPGATGASLLPYPLAALKQLNDATAGSVPTPTTNLLPLDHYRLQLYNYAMAERLRFSHGLSPYPAPLPLCPAYPPYGPRLAFSMSLFHHRALQPEEPKPQHSYIGLIAMAILSHPDTKLVLSDIYQYILDNYPYFRSRGPGWRNSIRHNLSLNDCFIKAGRSANGKGHYWAIHPANVEDFKKGDFRRRKAQRKVRKHMGLAVDEEGNDSPSPPPVPASPPPTMATVPGLCWAPTATSTTAVFPPLPCSITRKRQFDVASLLAPDNEEDFGGSRKIPRRLHPLIVPGGSYLSSGEEDAAEEDIDVVTSDQEGESKDQASRGDGSPRLQPQDAAASSQRLQQQPPVLSPWPHSAAGTHPLSLPQSVMFPPPSASLVSMEQQLVSRYYEQLAVAQQQQHRRLLQQQQQQQQSTLVCSLSPTGGSPLAEPTES